MALLSRACGLNAGSSHGGPAGCCRASLYAYWRRYLLDRLKRRGKLAGTVRPRRVFLVEPYVFFALCGLMLLVPLSVLRKLGAPWRWFEDGGAGRTSPLLALLALISVFAVVAVLALAAGLLRRRENLRTRARWSRWELTGEGLGRLSRAGVKHLPFSGTDLLSYDEIRIGEERFNPTLLTHQPVLLPVLFAFGERAGARFRRLQWARPSVFVWGLVIAAALVVLAWIVGLDRGWDHALRLVGLLSACFMVFVALLMLPLFALTRHSLRLHLEDGRSILEELRW